MMLVQWITRVVRWAFELYVIVKVFGETGPWTTFFAVCMTLAIEAQDVVNKMFLKDAKESSDAGAEAFERISKALRRET